MTRHQNPKKLRDCLFPGRKQQARVQHMHACLGTKTTTCKRRVACVGILGHEARCPPCSKAVSVETAAAFATGAT